MTENKFISLPVKKCFLTLTIPSMFSMFFSTLYMIIDGIFVGYYIGETALAAVNMAMPIIMIIFALSNMIAVGSSVKISLALGKKNLFKAQSLFSFSLMLILAISIFFSLVGIIFSYKIVFLLINDMKLAEFTLNYLYVFMFSLVFTMPLFALDNYLRVCGKANYSMFANIVVSILNIILDWLFIAKLGYGITASAVATIISITVGTIICFYPFFAKKLTLKFVKPRISKEEVIGMLYNGSSEFLSNIAGSISTIVINTILLLLGGTIAVASYGIVLYIDTLLVGVLYAIVDAIQPAVSYNVAVSKHKRAYDFFKVASIFTFTISLICMIIIIIFAEQLASLFTKQDNVNVINSTIIALLLFAPSYLFTWFIMLSSSFLSAIDKPKESLIIMFCETLALPLICVAILAPIFKVNGVFFAITLASLLSAIVTYIIWKSSIYKLKINSKQNIIN